MKQSIEQVVLVESLLLATSDARADVARLSRRLLARRDLWRKVVGERERLRKENTRLRAALTRIADEPGPDADDPIVFEYFARNVAKRALEVGK